MANLFNYNNKIQVVLMLSENIVRESRELQNLQQEDYKKVINYSINLILNRQNQMKLNEFIQIDEQKGDKITNICLTLITALSKYRNSSKQFDADINLLLLSKDKKQYLKEKLQAQLYELRKIIYSNELGNITQFKDLQWRFEIELSSKTSKNQFVPNILLLLQTQQKGVAKKTSINSDFANLKNMHQTLLQAMKMHNSSKFKAARNCST